MKKYFQRYLVFTVVLYLFCSFTNVLAQTNDPDELLIQAKNAAKDKKNYPAAVELLKKALVIAPNYADVRIQLGRIYTWSNNLDSARYQFNQVLAREPKNAEAISANFDLEYWNANYNRALDHANTGLLYFPDSALFIVAKAKSFVGQDNNKQALSLLGDYLKKHPDELDAKKYYTELLSYEKPKNVAGISYEYVYFDKRFPDPWQYLSAEYSRLTGLGYLTGRVNFSNRFATNGVQGEIEAYPAITKNLYAYVGAAFSNSNIFQRFRLGASFYYTLPKNFDAEAGIRYLDYRTTEDLIVVLAAGKYFGNYYINLRTYLSTDVQQFSHSYTLGIKYYFSDRFNTVGAEIGTGISPDDRARTITNTGNLSSYKFGINFSRDLIKNLTLSFNGIWYYEEYATSTWGNQISGGIALSRRF